MDEMQKLNLTQKAMAQFESLHGPKDSDDGTIVCELCEEDWPCERMGIMLISQAIAMLQSMIPSGNMASLLQRFSQSPR